MVTRFITYDLNYASSDEYSELYGLIDKYNGKQITESTYQIVTNEKWETFKTKFRNATHTGDNVKAMIVHTDKGIEVWTIR